MPADYRIDLARGLVISRGWGTLTQQDLLAHAGRLARDPRFGSDMRQLVDLCSVRTLELTSGGVREMVRINPFGAGARRALVVGNDVAFGMARMYQILRETEPDALAVFRELDPALEWLALTQDAAAMRAALEAIQPSSP